MKGQRIALSIKNKLILMMVAVSAAVLSVSTLLLYYNELDMVEQSAVESSQMQASLIAASVESAVIFRDERATKRVLNLLVTNTSVEYAAVISPDGLIFSEYRKPYRGHYQHDVDTLLMTTAEVNRQFIEVFAQVDDRGQNIATVLIRSNLDKVISQQLYYKEIAIAVMVLSLILAAVLAQCFHKLITRPLGTMVRHVTNISRDENYSDRLLYSSQDELGILAHGFNQMITVVQTREEELTKHNDNLQRIVAERTKQLYYKAHYDALTNLPNRYLLLERLSSAIVSAKHQQKKLAVMFMDLDRFKTINDSLGHDVGDELLQAVAQRLKHVGRNNDTVARLGGDEFVFLLADLESADDAGKFAQNILEQFSHPFSLKNNLLHISTSLGISVYPDDGVDGKVLLKHADLSMYHAKGQGQGCYSFYTNAMNETFTKRLEIEHQLRNAIKNDEFHLCYQPQIDLITNNLTQVEALLRWNNPVLGAVSPSVFIPIAEEIGIIIQVGEWCIDSACKQLQQWKNQNSQQIPVAINLSSSHLLAVNVVDYIRDTAAKYQISPTLLEIEITEDVFLEHSKKTIAALEQLQSLGIKIAIDDFGTGYSSLRYLKTLPVDTLKLDGMFVQDLEHSASSRGIVTSTISLAHSLNMKIVAECVETQAQADFLTTNLCDLVQGYYYYRPLSADAITQILESASDNNSCNNYL